MTRKSVCGGERERERKKERDRAAPDRFDRGQEQFDAEESHELFNAEL